MILRRWNTWFLLFPCHIKSILNLSIRDITLLEIEKSDIMYVARLSRTLFMRVNKVFELQYMIHKGYLSLKLISMFANVMIII